VSRVISLFNQAGGVGKSTLASNIGYSLAQRKRRVLLVDMDPQSSLTTFVGIDPRQVDRSVYHAIVLEEELPILKAIHGMDLVPSQLKLSDAEQELVTAYMRDTRLKDALEPVRDQYDFILIDCPPSLGMLSYISLVASDYILVPIQTQFKAFQGTDMLLQTLQKVKAKPNRKLQIAGFIPTMYDGRNSHDELTLEAIREQLAPLGKVFPFIPKSTVFADASMERVPLAVYSPKHPAKKILDGLAKDLEKLA
jgi:chromosome partitioning protein